MSDTQLILAHMDRRINELRDELIKLLRPKRKPKRKADPSLLEVIDYAKTVGRSDLAERFFNYYTVGKTKEEQWMNIKGPVYNWKNTFNTWCTKNPKEERSNSIWE